VRVQVPARVSFIGAVDSMTASATVASILVPIAGTHTVQLKLDSGAALGTYPLTVTAAATNAPSSVIEVSKFEQPLKQLCCTVWCGHVHAAYQQ
jgi:hypothetical protein